MMRAMPWPSPFWGLTRIMRRLYWKIIFEKYKKYKRSPDFSIGLMETELLQRVLAFRGLSDEDEEEVEINDADVEEDDDDDEEEDDDAAAGNDEDDATGSPAIEE